MLPKLLSTCSSYNLYRRLLYSRLLPSVLCLGSSDRVLLRWASSSSHSESIYQYTGVSNADILEEFKMPGKYRRFFKDRRSRSLKDDIEKSVYIAKKAPATIPAMSVSAFNGPQKHHRKLARRISRAISDILYSPDFSYLIPPDSTGLNDGDALSRWIDAWHVDKVEANAKGKVYVFWKRSLPDKNRSVENLLKQEVPTEDESEMVDPGTLAAFEKSLQKAIRAKLQLRYLPPVEFVWTNMHDTDQLLDVVELELKMMELKQLAESSNDAGVAGFDAADEIAAENLKKS
ncbi:hypothetical protein BKA69DRAFT_1072672 [Paraphysoderma sedebokerense]|nr:hypothetical protein BKA69DRAFT_1072672 [Paraphysoderma sedebokerense]